jgi:hypothetical protein
MLALRFELSDKAQSSKTSLLLELETILRRRDESGESTVLLVDEAQSLPREILEEIRLLANIETNDRKLLSVIMAGQPELTSLLNNVELRQLKQRVALRCELRPLTLQETAGYIAGRIRSAGGVGAQVFTREAGDADPRTVPRDPPHDQRHCRQLLADRLCRGPAARQQHHGARRCAKTSTFGATEAGPARLHAGDDGRHAPSRRVDAGGEARRGASRSSSSEGGDGGRERRNAPEVPVPERVGRDYESNRRGECGGRRPRTQPRRRPHRRPWRNWSPLAPATKLPALSQEPFPLELRIGAPSPRPRSRRPPPGSSYETSEPRQSRRRPRARSSIGSTRA